MLNIDLIIIRVISLPTCLHSLRLHPDSTVFYNMARTSYVKDPDRADASPLLLWHPKLGFCHSMSPMIDCSCASLRHSEASPLAPTCHDHLDKIKKCSNLFDNILFVIFRYLKLFGVYFIHNINYTITLHITHVTLLWRGFTTNVLWTRHSLDIETQLELHLIPMK